MSVSAGSMFSVQIPTPLSQPAYALTASRKSACSLTVPLFVVHRNSIDTTAVIVRGGRPSARLAAPSCWSRPSR